MDITLTPFVDVVGDAHALPFLPGTFDFIFSLAVIEHLRQPFIAAQEMNDALRTGGYVYGECNFVFPYHGYPYHFFNASQQGLEEVFASFTKLRSSVAPYQMPSFAVKSTLTIYRQLLAHEASLQPLFELLDQVCQQPLGTYDQYLTEGEALQLAAGVFFFGVKGNDGASDIIPPAVQRAWRQSPVLQEQFPNMLDLGHVENIITVGKINTVASKTRRSMQRSRKLYHFISILLSTIAAYRHFRQRSLQEPAFGHIAEPTDQTPYISKLAQRDQYIARLEDDISQKNAHIARLRSHIQHIAHGRVMRLLRLLRK